MSQVPVSPVSSRLLPASGCEEATWRDGGDRPTGVGGRRRASRCAAITHTWSGCTRSGLFCYSDTSTAMDPEQLFVVSDSPVTASTHAP